MEASVLCVESESKQRKPINFVERMLNFGNVGIK